MKLDKNVFQLILSDTTINGENNEGIKNRKSLKVYLQNKIKHLIEEQFEHRNTNSFKLSVCLFYLGKLNKDLSVQFSAKQSSTTKLQSHP